IICCLRERRTRRHEQVEGKDEHASDKQPFQHKEQPETWLADAPDSGGWLAVGTLRNLGVDHTIPPMYTLCQPRTRYLQNPLSRGLRAHRLWPMSLQLCRHGRNSNNRASVSVG